MHNVVKLAPSTPHVRMPTAPPTHEHGCGCPGVQRTGEPLDAVSLAAHAARTSDDTTTAAIAQPRMTDTICTLRSALDPA